MAQRRGPAPSDEQMETVIQALDDLIQAKRAKSYGCQLDRQRDPIEATREFQDGGLVVRGHLEGRSSLPCALDQQGDRL